MAGKGHGGSGGLTAWNGLLEQYADGRCAGNVRYVGAGGTNGDNYGRTAEQPYLTIQYAIDALAATNDDLILVEPGHTTTLTAAGTLTANKAGVTIRGYGWPMPVINYTTNAAASLNITAANVVLEHFLLTMTGVAAVTAGINVSAAGVVLRDLEIEQGDGTNCAVLGVLTTAAANRLLVERVNSYTGSVATAAAAIRLVGGTGITVRDCILQGKYGSAIGAIENLTTPAVRAMILNNVIQNYTASCTKAMVFDTTATGQLADNRMQILSGTAPITGLAMSWAGRNYYSNALGAASVLI